MRDPMPRHGSGCGRDFDKFFRIAPAAGPADLAESGRTVMLLEINDDFLRAVCESWPEASAGSCLRCTCWSYKEMRFGFYDDETGKNHVVGLEDLRRGLEIFFGLLLSGKFRAGLGTGVLLDPGNWDGELMDGLAQAAIFGEVRYG